MNCIPRIVIQLASVLVCSACGAPATDALASGESRDYGLEYTLRLVPGESRVYVGVEVRQDRALLREISFAVDKRIDGLEGDGVLERSGDRWVWRPPERGGTLRWSTAVNHHRGNSSYDAWLGSDWGLFRAEDVIPRAASRTLKGASSSTGMRIRAPHGWSVVSQYARHGDRFAVDDPDRRFDQPSGWIVAGNLGVRRETIAGVHVAVAAPVGQSVRRMDILALLHWTLPEIAAVVPQLPDRITIVSAAEPMWRGGLSAPMSLFLHADRPLISENGTSTLLHEVLHLSLGVSAAKGHDWIAEGLAEYYGLEILRRSETISASRFRQALAALESWSKDSSTLCGPASTGPVTARAVMVFAALDREIRDLTDRRASLDDVVQALSLERSPVDVLALRRVAEQVAKQAPDSLGLDNLPGCRTITADDDA